MNAPCIPVVQLCESGNVAGGSAGHELLVLDGTFNIRGRVWPLFPHVARMAASAAKVRLFATSAADGCDVASKSSAVGSG